MHEKVMMYALKDFKYAENPVKAGSPFEVRKKDVKVLIAIKRASLNDVGVAVEDKSTDSAVGEDSGEASNDLSSMDKDALRDEYKRVLGKSAHGRTSEETLREEIEKARGESG